MQPGNEQISFWHSMGQSWDVEPFERRAAMPDPSRAYALTKPFLR
jgi:hypothetical protein